VEIEDNVEFADVAEVLVQVFYEEVDELNDGNPTSRCRSSLSLISMQIAK
jgi:hypothetical protein